jgi:hypothetical protein
LIFLTRDWPNKEDFDYGFDGGRAYLNEEVMKIDDDHQQNMKDLRKYIIKAFEVIEGS